MYNNEKSIAQQAELMEQWKKYGLNNPHLFIVKNTPGNDDCIRFLQQLTKVGLTSSNIRRSAKRSFLYQKLKKDCTDYELIRLLDSPHLVSDIYNEFIGVFAIDISDFVSDCADERLRILLDFAQDHQDSIRFCFIVNTNLQNQEKDLMTFVSKKLILRRFEFVTLNIEHLMDYVDSKNKENKVSFDQQAVQYLETMFIEMLESKSVESLTEMIRLYDSLIYEYRDTPSSVSKDQLHQSLKGSKAESEAIHSKRKFGF